MTILTIMIKSCNHSNLYLACNYINISSSHFLCFFQTLRSFNQKYVNTHILIVINIMNSL